MATFNETGKGVSEMKDILARRLGRAERTRVAFRLGDDGFYVALPQASLDHLGGFEWREVGFSRAAQKAVTWLESLNLPEAMYLAAFYTSTAEPTDGDLNGFRVISDDTDQIRCARILPARV